MKEIGNRIFDDLTVQPGERRYDPFFEYSRFLLPNRDPP